MSSSTGSINSSLASYGGHSATVRLSLNIDGRTLRPSQVGGGHLYFSEPVSIPAGVGELVVEVDGNARRKSIRVHEATQPFRMVGYSPVE
jgi:hypothetical protein